MPGDEAEADTEAAAAATAAAATAATTEFRSAAAEERIVVAYENNFFETGDNPTAYAHSGGGAATEDFLTSQASAGGSFGVVAASRSVSEPAELALKVAPPAAADGGVEPASPSSLGRRVEAPVGVPAGDAAAAAASCRCTSS